jgi:hypothetical protein
MGFRQYELEPSLDAERKKNNGAGRRILKAVVATVLERDP